MSLLRYPDTSLEVRHLSAKELWESDTSYNYRNIKPGSTKNTDLGRSLRDAGQKAPLVACEDADGKLIQLAGFRRMGAVDEDFVFSVIVLKGLSVTEQVQIVSGDNVARKGFTQGDYVRAVRDFKKAGMTNETIAALLGKSVDRIRQWMDSIKWPEELLTELDDVNSKFSQAHGMVAYYYYKHVEDFPLVEWIDKVKTAETKIGPEKLKKMLELAFAVQLQKAKEDKYAQKIARYEAEAAKLTSRADRLRAVSANTPPVAMRATPVQAADTATSDAGETV
jgi:hypothetical protein